MDMLVDLDTSIFTAGNIIFEMMYVSNQVFQAFY